MPIVISQQRQVLDLLKILNENGFIVTKIDDGGEEDEIHTGSTVYHDTQYQYILNHQVVDIVLAVDEAKVYITDIDTGCQNWLWCLWGNNPGELVADYAIPKNVDSAKKLDKVMDIYGDFYEVESE